MGHKGGTHSENAPMEKGVYKRGNKFYFRKRIPQDLIGHPEFVTNGKNETERKGSLGTSEPKEANRLALNKSAELENLFKAARQQIESGRGAKALTLPTPVIPLTRTEKVSKWDIDRIWIAEFERLEKEAVVERKQLNDYKVDSDDPDEMEAARDGKQEAVSTLYHEYERVDPKSSNGVNCIDWDQYAKDRLELNGVKVNELRESEVAYLATRMQDVNKEVLLRTIDVANGYSSRVHDVLLERAKEGFRYVSSAETEGDGITIGELCRMFIRNKKVNHADTVEGGEYATTIRILKDFFGEDTDTSKITTECCYDFMEFLKVVPANAAIRYKKYDKGTLVELSKRVQKMPDSKQHFLSPATQHKHFNRFVFILSSPNDTNGLKKVKNCPLRDKQFRDLLPLIPDKEKVMVTDEDLSIMLRGRNFQKYRQRRSETGGYQSGKYWAILICMHQGMRINEACQLLNADVRSHEGIYYFNISLTDEEGLIVKSLKTKASKRLVPIHSKLIELGFITFCKAQRELTDSAFLFPELVPKRGHDHSKETGRLFKRLLDEFIDPSTRPNNGDKMTHTLRHRVTNKLRSAKIDAETRYFLMGWSRGEAPIKLNAGSGYGEKVENLPYLKEIIETHVVFPNFHYSVLKVWKPS